MASKYMNILKHLLQTASESPFKKDNTKFQIDLSKHLKKKVCILYSIE